MLLSLRLDGATFGTDGRLFEGLYQRDGWLPLFDGPYPHVSIGSGGGDGREKGPGTRSPLQTQPCGPEMTRIQAQGNVGFPMEAIHNEPLLSL
jgi:hypothetical protein